MPVNALYPIVGVVAILGVGFALLLRKLAARPANAGSPFEWLETFSPESYTPMERLLDERDFEFLASQPGYDPAIAKKLRLERKAVFQSYLSRLVRDFNQLLAMAKLMVVFAGEDRTEFATSLWRQQITFYWAICMIEARLALYPMVLGTWDVQGLLGTLRRFHGELVERAALALPQSAI